MSNRIRFLLGRIPREVEITDPTETVLDWLRLRERRRGTKEGCAEGDCGACTVALGERGADGHVRYRAVNSCIQFLPTLDGKQLVTVEDLADPGDGALHPAQQAMVDAHGSQCGFCTPGFVMALWTLYQAQDAATDRATACDRLAGNLCRCTGYRPILQAAARMFDVPRPVEPVVAAAAERLAPFARKDTLSIEAAGRHFFAPRTADALADLVLQHPDACLLAGGTDVGLWVTKQHRALPAIIHVGEVTELQRVERRDGGWWIGAAATYERAAPAFEDLHPDMAELLRRIGGWQVRSAGTVGGNIANGSPIGDTLPALIALGATLHLRRGAATRVLPIEEFFLAYRRTALQPGEFLEGVHVAALDGSQRFATYKLSKRFDQDISAVCPAYRITLQDGVVREARIAHGGMAATPKRAAAAEAALTGRPWGETGVRAAMDALGRDYAPIDDMRASASYRLTAARNLLWRFWLENGGGGAPTRVIGPQTAEHAA